jgi:hypothetical protein
MSYPRDEPLKRVQKTQGNRANSVRDALKALQSRSQLQVCGGRIERDATTGGEIQ